MNQFHENVNHVIKHQIQLFDVDIESVDVYMFVLHFHIEFYFQLVFEFQLGVKQLVVYQNFLQLMEHSKELVRSEEI